MKNTAAFFTLVILTYSNHSWSEANINNSLIEIEVNRSPTCSCCEKWVAHLENNNFKINDNVTDSVQAIKSKYNIGPALASCHTAIVNGHVIEGHVPASDIKALLNQRTAIVGLSVPGMPIGTPGMEMGGKKESYQVISFDKQGNSKVFNDYPAK